MSDPAVARWLIVGVVFVAAVAVAVVANRSQRRTARRAMLDLSGFDGRVLFFTDATCTRCQIVRAHLEGLAVAFTEIAYDAEPEAVRRAGVSGVPLLILRDESGAEMERFAGVVPKRRLAAAIRSAGIGMPKFRG